MDGISQEGKRFRAIVADSRPHYEGRAMLAKLLASGIPCTYLQLNALSYAMQVSAVRHGGFKGALFLLSPCKVADAANCLNCKTGRSYKQDCAYPSAAFLIVRLLFLASRGIESHLQQEKGTSARFQLHRALTFAVYMR